MPRADALPLSFAQQRLWLVDQLEPGSAAYNIPSALRMHGTLDVSALERSFTALVERHESLRTTFLSREGEPVQVIHPVGPFSLPIVELGMLPEEDREQRAQQLATEEAQRPFDLARGPVLRATLARLSAEDHVLMVTMHHAISDGWSMGILIQELASFYEAFATGETPRLAPLSIQYADFAAWQRSWLKGDVMEGQLSYWRKQLGGLPPLLELPTDRTRPPVRSSRGGSQPVRLSRELTERLSALCRKEGATPFMALLAAWQVLLARYSGQDDVSVGSPIAGRTRAETEGLIGFFVNTLVLRTHVNPSLSFRALLAQVRATTLAAYEHQDVPFEKLVEELKPQRSLSHTPLFQVMLSLQNLPVAHRTVSGPSADSSPLRLESFTQAHQSTKFDLTLTLSETPDGLAGSLSYRVDLFEDSTIQRWAEHLHTFLAAAISSPDSRVGELPMLSAQERRQVLSDWNSTLSEVPWRGAFHQLFEAQAALTPDALAVLDDDSSLSFSALNQRSNQLAHFLRARGVGPESRVAFCLERSTSALVALLSILKAGAAYVPLDASYPLERLSFMLEDSRAPFVLTQSHLLPRLSSSSSPLCLDDKAFLAALDALPTSNPSHLTLPSHPAYVIYTSGSTGRPKGVVIHHSSVVNLLHALSSSVFSDVTRPLRFSLNAPLSFDASVKQLVFLSQGHALCFVPQAAREDVPLLLSWLSRHSVDVFDCAPSHLRLLLDEGLSSFHRPLRLLIGGESIDDSLWASLSSSPNLHPFNVYGPTECTVDATALSLRASSRPVLGPPLPNVSTFILDSSLLPSPVGVPGELFIGGLGLARGYLHRPDLTAERFVPNPFSSSPGARLYRTGDKARWLPNGHLEYLGRIDFQVKLRGFRIELGEIEAALEALPSVHHAAVLLREDVPGLKRLVAYVTPSSLDVSALRSSLLTSLPDYMVPSAFVALDSLPINAHGKLDRAALPPPDSAPSDSFLAPRNPTEALLASIWADVLHLDSVSVSDDFFSLGGHSLLATQVVSRIRKALGVELPLRVLFEAPTVAALAARIQAQGNTSLELQRPPLVPVPRTGPLPLSFAQQRLWFLDQLLPGSATYNMPTFVRLDGSLDIAALQRGFDELVRRHESLRTTFIELDGQPFQQIAPEGQLPVTRVNLRGIDEEASHSEVQRLLREEYQRPFNLSTGPLIRTMLLELSDTEHVLALNMHHIVSDGWSMGVLIREVAALYDAFSKEKPSPLAPLAIQYADYSAWQRDWLQGEVLDSQLAYWRNQLASAPNLALPIDKPRPPVQTFNGASTSVSISGPVAKRLKALCRSEGATPFMALLATWQLLLARHSGQDDIVVGSPIAGRHRAELESLIGFFVNTLVFRARIAPHESFLGLLRQVKEFALNAYAHQDIPFERLVEELHPARDLSRSPLFQVIFALQNTPESAIQKTDLTLSPVGVGGVVATAKFELTLNLTETPDGISGSLGYNTDLFEQATIERMARHFEVLVEAITSRPEVPIAEHSLLTEMERREVLVDWAQAPARVSTDDTMPEAFARVVARSPDATALLFGEESLSYRQVDTRSNQLAWHLRSLGVSTDTRVAVSLERSPDLIVALLAVLKAGAAYVPLDTQYPPERLASMVEDARPSILLTSRALLSKLPSEGLTLVLLDDVALSERPAHALPPSALPDSLAYVVFTSGSTGKPKGVACTHRGVVHTLLGVDYTTFNHEQTHLLLAPISFDATVFEVWGALLHGARLVVLPPLAPSLEDLFGAISRHAVTTLWATSGLFSQLVESRLPAPPSLQRVLTGGDVVSPLHVREALTSWGLPVTNCYGPTEITVLATAFSLARADDVGTCIPIGRPTNGTRLLVLDASLQPVPVGVTGELFIGGEGLARGYLGQPALTAERFVPDPFSASPGARLYRSGDLVRWSPDGVLDFIGRSDAQVKVRGFRIELSEVEAALLAHPSVREAVALAREDAPGDKRLVGYFVADDLDSVSLRAFLKSRLPEFMVPSSLLRLDALPLTSNAKIDRKALPPPEAVLHASAASQVAPRTPTEEVLATAWADVLRVPKVGITDDFFELGGHSLLAIKLMAKIRERTRVSLPVAALFQGSSIERLAAILEQHQGSTRALPNLVRLDSGSSNERPLFIVHGGGGSALGYTELVRHLAPSRPIHGFSASGLDGGELPPASVEILARDYLSQLRVVQPHGPYLLAGWSFGGLVAYEMARRLQSQGEQVEMLVMVDSHAPRPEPRPMPDELSQLVSFSHTLGLPWQSLPLDPERLRRLAGRERLAYLLEQARDASMGLDMDVDTAERLFALHQRLTAAQLTYVPTGASYEGSTVLIKAATSLSGVKVADDLGWSAWLASAPTVHEAPGNHYTMLRAPHVTTLAELFARLLESLKRDAA
ncbi:amino acid adenylation domain-containing protein [Myxococcus stipitatus]